MTQAKERLSAFIDGEQSPDADISVLVNDLNRDHGLAAKWQRYHLMRDCLRGDLSTDLQFDISAKVAQAIEQEPYIIAPQSSWRDKPVVAAIIPLIKQSGQLAVAACVTAVMIFSYQSYNQPDPTQPFLTAPPAANIGIQGGMAPVSLQQSVPSKRNDINLLLEQRRQINALIEDHQRQLKLKNAGITNVLEGTPEKETERESKPQG